MRFAVALGRMHPSMFLDAVVAADELGFDSVWMPEHVVLPVGMAGSPFAGADHPPLPPSTPVYDVFAYLGFLAARTSRVRLGTHVYNLALRHPFVAARAVQTLDLVSGGRAELGVGVGWMRAEWDAMQLDFSTRGRRLDEALDLCIALWTEQTVAHHGEFFSFDEVMFEPKPVQQPHPPVVIGGESDAALRRAARFQGWIGMHHSVESVRAPLRRLRELRHSGGADGPFTVTVGAQIEGEDDVEALAAAGVDRIIVSPWNRTREVPDALGAFARRYLG
ncbi:MAG: TIGR03619 family F420-dependent LLM class oxidoreductase [Acidimicrobiales bacterium]